MILELRNVNVILKNVPNALKKVLKKDYAKHVQIIIILNQMNIFLNRVLKSVIKTLFIIILMKN